MAFLNVTIVGANETQAKLNAYPPAVLATLFAKVQSLTLQLEAMVKNDKLSGQVLNVRTGNLKASIFSKWGQDGSTMYGQVGSGGTVKYAAFWEFGFHGTENVRQHYRTVVFGKTVDPFLVGPFSRRVDQAPRSFLQSSLSDMTPTITRELKAAMIEAARQVGLGGA